MDEIGQKLTNSHDGTRNFRLGKVDTVLSHYPRKRFGQNFLHDQSVIEPILSFVDPRPGDKLVEIGPGQGALTRGLLDNEQIAALEARCCESRWLSSSGPVLSVWPTASTYALSNSQAYGRVPVEASGLEAGHSLEGP